MAAPRADRGQDVFRGGRAEQPHRALGGLLDRLEQGVARRVGQAVGVLDDHHLPARAHRRERRPPDQVTHVVDADRQLLGADDGTSGWDDAATVWQAWHSPQPCSLALQRRGERHRSVGAARARRAGEQPRVGHPAPGRGRAEDVDHVALADQPVPDRHDASRLAWPSSGTTRPRTAAAISSTGSRASSTR